MPDINDTRYVLQLRVWMVPSMFNIPGFLRSLLRICLDPIALNWLTIRWKLMFGSDIVDGWFGEFYVVEALDMHMMLVWFGPSDSNENSADFWIVFFFF